MEDTARLAVFEQSVDKNLFEKSLLGLLELLRDFLKNHDYLKITLMSDSVKKGMSSKAFCDYLGYLGFEFDDKTITLVKYDEMKLKNAKEAIDRKLRLSGMLVSTSSSAIVTHAIRKVMKIEKINPSFVILTSNSFLESLQHMFNDVLKYEDEKLQQEALSQIPIYELETKALNRVREYQKKIKIDQSKSDDLPFDIALLMELLNWFKYSFFKWMDKPECSKCGSHTNHLSTTQMNVQNEYCRVEIYQCKDCSSITQFPRFKNCSTLLKTRTGRCGEWADCFMLVARSLGYDTRMVHDTTDHVWCEVYDFSEKKWLHADPCEAKLNAPLIYEHGWGKKLQYVIAFSKDDIQDVTWRYTSKHKETRLRRKLCTEVELLQTILTLREDRQQQLSVARRKYLAKRTLEELIEMCIERSPSDYENQGRISGSREWRSQRGEIGSNHTFTIDKAGAYSLSYSTTRDMYVFTKDNVESEKLPKWRTGVYGCANVFRKRESDWHMVYLAREEGEDYGWVSWRIATENANLNFTSIVIQASSAIYEDGNIKWSICLDDEEPKYIKLDEFFQMVCKFSTAVIKVELSGGRGDVAWQHAQLFRQHEQDESNMLLVDFKCENVK